MFCPGRSKTLGEPSRQKRQCVCPGGSPALLLAHSSVARFKAWMRLNGLGVRLEMWRVMF